MSGNSYYCTHCNAEIKINEKVRITPDKQVFHEECLQEMSASEFADYQDIDVQII